MSYSDPNRSAVLVTDASVTTVGRRISWGAVFAGGLVALMVMLLINLLTLGFGLQSINPATEADPLAGLGRGALIGVIIANVLALFIGGWVAGRLAASPNRLEGALHGILTWGLVTLLSFWLLSSAVGRLVGGVTAIVGQGLGAVAQGAAAIAPEAAQAVEDALAAQGVSFDGIHQEANQLLQQVTEGEVQPAAAADQAAETAQDIAQNPQQAGQEINQLIDQVFGENPSETVTQEDLVTALVANSSLTQAEAEQTVANWQQTAQQAEDALQAARQDLEEAAQAASDAVGSAAVWAFFGLLLGALIAAVGSLLGKPKEAVVVQ